MVWIPILLALSSASLAIAFPSPVDRDQKILVDTTVYEHERTGTTMSFVSNSGICETTPGVNQVSGYISVGKDMHMWFWFFEARDSPSTAPLALWLNGGPGCSSMIGLFQENGPCTFNNVSGSTPVLNPHSWNNVANMLYVDQPIGTGFSYGSETVESTTTAAPFVWKLLQAFYDRFPKYKNHKFGLFTESYGGHYGPKFVDYFESKNDAIMENRETGTIIPLVALGINNGWIDGRVQYKTYIDYALENPYRALINSSQAASLLDAYYKECLPALNTCSRSHSDIDCSNAYNTCLNDVEIATAEDSPLNFDPYDLRHDYPDSFPSPTYFTYLQSKDVMNAIGARAPYQNCSTSVFQKFNITGDFVRSSLSALSEVLEMGNVHVLIWAGDADWICNTKGVHECVSKLEFSDSATFNSKQLEPYTVNGKQYGMFKTAGKLSFLSVFGAGHEVPAYQPIVALQVFTQTMAQEPLTST